MPANRRKSSDENSGGLRMDLTEDAHAIAMKECLKSTRYRFKIIIAVLIIVVSILGVVVWILVNKPKDSIRGNKDSTSEHNAAPHHPPRQHLPTALPTVQPSSAITAPPSALASPHPTLEPSFAPTLPEIQIAPATISAHCSESNIHSREGLAECLMACAPASCCDSMLSDWLSSTFIAIYDKTLPAFLNILYEELDGNSLILNVNDIILGSESSSCYRKNEEVCGTYSICQTALTHSRPNTPPDNLSILCSAENVMLPETGRVWCENACDSGACCFTGCEAHYGSTCEGYSPCKNLHEVTLEPKVIVPNPPASLEEICSFSSMTGTDTTQSTIEECRNSCRVAECCNIKGDVTDNKSGVQNCYEENKGRCDLYNEPCSHVKGIPPVPSNFILACEDASIAVDETECRTYCDPVACCINEGDDSCYKLYEESCFNYASCLNLELNSDSPFFENNV